jgi:hypothetical protein
VSQRDRSGLLVFIPGFRDVPALWRSVIDRLALQLQHDRALQESQRRSEVATELGWALREVSEGVDRIDGDAAMTTERNWNGLPQVSRATRRAQIFGIPDDDAALRLAVDLARDMHWRWR